MHVRYTDAGSTSSPSQRKLAEVLLAAGVLGTEDLKRAESRSGSECASLAKVLVELGYVPEQQLAKALSLVYGLELARFEQFPLDSAATASVPEDVARRFSVLPLKKLGSDLVCAIFDPGDAAAVDAVEVASECALKLLVAPLTEIAIEIDRRYGIGIKRPRQNLPVGPGDMFLHYRLGSVRCEEPGVVFFEADDTRLLRKVNVALIPRELPESLGKKSTRFLEHSLWLARFPHRHILTVHDVGEFEGSRFVVTEALQGETLAERLERERKLQIPAAVNIAVQLCDALDHLHRHQLVYRSLSPSNCLLMERKEVKLTHLGLGWEHTDSLETSSLATAQDLRYRSPEYLNGEPLDGRSDLFSIGAILYEMASGWPAFPGANPAVVSRLILEGGLAPHEELPPALNRIILRACARDRHGRYLDAPSLADDLLTQFPPNTTGRREVPSYLAAVDSNLPHSEEDL